MRRQFKSLVKSFVPLLCKNYLIFCSAVSGLIASTISSATPLLHSSQVEKILSKMTLKEKVGQMIQINTSSIVNAPALMTEYQFGSVLNAAGSEGPDGDPTKPETWIKMIQGMQDRAKIPILYGIDAVHGHAAVAGATVFPHAIGLGASRDKKLVRRIGHATGVELKSFGIHWNFAPALSVAKDLRWGRIYESFSENATLVKNLGAAYIDGIQEAGVMACAKHYLGDGGTTWGSTDGINLGTLRETYKLDQGNTDPDTLLIHESEHFIPYPTAISRGVQSVMVSYSKWGGLKMHAHKRLISKVLKDRYRFGGIVVSDYLGPFMQNDGPEIKQLERSVNAGIDMIMAGHEYEKSFSMLLTLVETGRVSTQRIDDAVRRILKTKEELGLFNGQWKHTAAKLVGSKAHLKLANEAARKSAVLLKNIDHTLPIDPKTKQAVLLIGRGGNNMGLQSGGWTLRHQGVDSERYNSRILGDTILSALEKKGLEVVYDRDGWDHYHHETEFKYDKAIVVASETPYAEGLGDTKYPQLSEVTLEQIRIARHAAEQVILLLLTGRPVDLSLALRDSRTVDAIVAGWLPGSGGVGLVDVLLGKSDFTGRLSFSWPTYQDYNGKKSLESTNILYDYDFGLSYQANSRSSCMAGVCKRILSCLMDSSCVCD